MIFPAPRHRRHPAALPVGQSETDRTPRQRSAPRTVEEAKLNLRVTAASRDQAPGNNSGSLVGDVASSAIRFAKDHPAAVAAGVGVVAVVIGPGALLKGVTTGARLATLAGLLGKAAK